MRPFPTATCFHETDTKRSICICFLLLLFPIFPCAFEFPFVSFSALGSSCIMTKRDSLLAGFTYPSSSMSMPRRHSRTSGYPSSTAAPSDSLNPSRSVTDSTASTALPTALPSLRHAGSSDQTSHYGYSTADTSTPIPAPADHQTPIPPRREEAYPLQREMAETRRQLHAHYFTEVRTPQADNSQPELRRLMVTEVDQYGVHRNRQPEFFFNGIIGHIRADENGWIDSWDQATQLANYWRRHFQIPEVTPDGNCINIRKSPTVRTKLEKAKNPCRDQIWKTRNPSLPMQHLHRHRVRSTSWLPFCGTFPTMTEGPTWPFSRNWKPQRTIRSRSSRQQTWPTLRATWHRPLAICHIELNKWRRSPTSAIESDYSELKVF